MRQTNVLIDSLRQHQVKGRVLRTWRQAMRYRTQIVQVAINHYRRVLQRFVWSVFRAWLFKYQQSVQLQLWLDQQRRLKLVAAFQVWKTRWQNYCVADEKSMSLRQDRLAHRASQCFFHWVSLVKSLQWSRNRASMEFSLRRSFDRDR